jgi:hypothetical protein
VCQSLQNDLGKLGLRATGKEAVKLHQQAQVNVLADRSLAAVAAGPSNTLDINALNERKTKPIRKPFDPIRNTK